MFWAGFWTVCCLYNACAITCSLTLVRSHGPSPRFSHWHGSFSSSARAKNGISWRENSLSEWPILILELIPCRLSILHLWMWVWDPLRRDISKAQIVVGQDWTLWKSQYRGYSFICVFVHVLFFTPHFVYKVFCPRCQTYDTPVISHRIGSFAISLAGLLLLSGWDGAYSDLWYICGNYARATRAT